MSHAPVQIRKEGLHKCDGGCAVSTSLRTDSLRLSVMEEGNADSDSVGAVQNACGVSGTHATRRYSKQSVRRDARAVDVAAIGATI